MSWPKPSATSKSGDWPNSMARTDRALFDQLANEILRDFPNHLPVLVEQLKRADGTDREDHLTTVVAAADDVIAQIDTTALAAHYGVKLDPRRQSGCQGPQGDGQNKRRRSLTPSTARPHALF